VLDPFVQTVGLWHFSVLKCVGFDSRQDWGRFAVLKRAGFDSRRVGGHTYLPDITPRFDVFCTGL
jgi:hypothetical protein